MRAEEREYEDGKARFSIDDLRNVVNEYCDCGGLGPSDAGVCTACLIWHALMSELGEP